MVDNILQMSLPYSEVKNQPQGYFYNLIKGGGTTNLNKDSNTFNMPKANQPDIKSTNPDIIKEFSFSKSTWLKIGERTASIPKQPSLQKSNQVPTQEPLNFFNNNSTKAFETFANNIQIRSTHNNSSVNTKDKVILPTIEDKDRLPSFGVLKGKYVNKVRV